MTRAIFLRADRRHARRRAPSGSPSSTRMREHLVGEHAIAAGLADRRGRIRRVKHWPAGATDRRRWSARWPCRPHPAYPGLVRAGRRPSPAAGSAPSAMSRPIVSATIRSATPDERTPPRTWSSMQTTRLDRDGGGHRRRCLWPSNNRQAVLRGSQRRVDQRLFVEQRAGRDEQRIADLVGLVVVAPRSPRFRRYRLGRASARQLRPCSARASARLRSAGDGVDVGVDRPRSPARRCRGSG